MARPLSVTDRYQQYLEWVINGLIPYSDPPPVEALPRGWAVVLAGCQHERFPRHLCETFAWSIYVGLYAVTWDHFELG